MPIKKESFEAKSFMRVNKKISLCSNTATSLSIQSSLLCALVTGGLQELTSKYVKLGQGQTQKNQNRAIKPDILQGHAADGVQ